MITEVDFLSANGRNSWKLVDESHPLKLYVGIDEDGRYALEYMGSFVHNKNVKSSKLIEINHYKMSKDVRSMVLSLTDTSCLREFCIFCNDLVDSTSKLSKFSKKGYETLCNLYFTWQKMFKSHSEILSEHEIKGLIGELLFLKDEMFPLWGISNSISSWTGPDASKKDFSIENTWYEIKTIEYGKKTVGISSLEQLESLVDGVLVVYQLEKMSSGFNGITLNNLINEILHMVSLLPDKQLFIDKLHKVGFSFSDVYDEYVYDKRELSKYRVNESFPKLVKNRVPQAIAKAAYEITLSEIIKYKL